MNRPTAAAVIIVLGLAGGALGYGLYQWTSQAPPQTGAYLPTTPQGVLQSPRPEFTLMDLDDRPHSITEWDGKVVLLNFWATWCPPCRREIPDFQALQREYGARGLQVVGVAIDQPHLVEEYRDTMGIDYPLLVGEVEAVEIARHYGNQYGQLPYTVIIDRQGRIAAVKRGELLREEAEKLLLPLL